jgi:hypothetical protein
MRNLTAYDTENQRVIEFTSVLDFISFKLKQLAALGPGRRLEARRYEHDIWEQALRAIADGDANARAIAWAALQTDQFSPPDWLDPA